MFILLYHQGAVPQILGDTKEDFFLEKIKTLKLTADICYSKIKDIPCIICPSKPEGSMFVMVRHQLRFFSIQHKWRKRFLIPWLYIVGEIESFTTARHQR